MGRGPPGPASRITPPRARYAPQGGFGVGAGAEMQKPDTPAPPKLRIQGGFSSGLPKTSGAAPFL